MNLNKKRVDLNKERKLIQPYLHNLINSKLHMEICTKIYYNENYKLYFKNTCHHFVKAFIYNSL